MRVFVVICILGLGSPRLEAQTTDDTPAPPAVEETVSAVDEATETPAEEETESDGGKETDPPAEEDAVAETEEEIDAADDETESPSEDDADASSDEEMESYDDDDTYDADDMYEDEESFDEEEGLSGRNQMFLVGPGFSLGFFLSDDDADGLLNYVPRITLHFVPIEYVQVQIPFEIGVGPKSSKDDEGNKNKDNIIRGSFGGVLNLHLPFREKYSLFAGAGALLHIMKFDETTGTDWGFRGQVGFRWYTGVLAPEIFVAYDHVKSENTSVSSVPESEDTAETDTQSLGVTLDFTSVMVGFNLLFNAT